MVHYKYIELSVGETQFRQLDDRRKFTNLATIEYRFIIFGVSSLVRSKFNKRYHLIWYLLLIDVLFVLYNDVASLSIYNQRKEKKCILFYLVITIFIIRPQLRA